MMVYPLESPKDSQQTFRCFYKVSESAQTRRLIASYNFCNQISLYFVYLASQLLLDGCYIFYVMKSAFDFQISLTINCESTWLGLA